MVYCGQEKKLDKTNYKYITQFKKKINTKGATPVKRFL